MNAPLQHVHTITLHLPLPKGRTQELEVLETANMTLLGAIKQARGSLPATWLDSFVCHAGACNTCGIVIDGKPGVPCTALVRELGRTIRLLPNYAATEADFDFFADRLQATLAQFQTTLDQPL